MKQDEQQFLNELEKKLWTSANKLLPSLDASQYKHVALGLVFLKYVSDSFDIRRKELTEQFKTKKHEYFLDPADFDGGEEGEAYQSEIDKELEERDYYAEANVFWVPQQARWEFLQSKNKVVITGEIEIPDGKMTKKIRSVGQLIDNALEAIEHDNPKLKGVLNKRYTQLQIDQSKLGELIDLIATIPFVHDSLSSKDILGHVYEYFLGQFALAEGKKGGQFYTPKSIVSLIVQMLEPFKGRVYDPAMGSGGFFVQSENFITAHKGRIGDLSIYGQEANHTTWQLAAMNMVIRGIDFNFGKEPASTYTNDQHPDLRADFVMANPPFNMKEWDTGVDDNDPRWQYGRPPTGNANFAWMQHMYYHLAPRGKAGIVLANGSLSSNAKDEFDIRKRMIKDDIIDCVLMLPSQLFTNTQIAASIWILNRDKKSSHRRERETLFIDAKSFGYMDTKVIRKLSVDELNMIADTYNAWANNREFEYKDVPQFCKSVNTSEIKEHRYALVPGRYVGFDKSRFFSSGKKSDIVREFNDIYKRLDEIIEETGKSKTILKEMLNG